MTWALGASLLTAWVLDSLLEVSGMAREAIEGLTMVVAAGVLFYVSYWLIAKSEAARWQAWVRGRIDQALSRGSLFALGAAQFVPKRPRPGGERYTEKTVCPTMISIPHKRESRHCIECFRCVQPEARGGLALRLRRPGEEIERIDAHHPNPYETAFLFLSCSWAPVWPWAASCG